MYKMSKRPVGRPPAPCATFSPSSKRCFGRENHPYIPYRCDCVEKPKKAKRPLKYVSNPLFTSRIVRKPTGRQRMALNWSQNGMPKQIVNMQKRLDREREIVFITTALSQQKERLIRTLPSNQQPLRTQHAALMKRFDKLMSANPKRISSLNKVSTRFMSMGDDLENAIATLPVPRLAIVRRRDPSANSALGAYWTPSSRRRVSVPSTRRRFMLG